MGRKNVPMCPRENSPELRRIWNLQDELMEAHREYRKKVLADAQRHKEIIKAERFKQIGSQPKRVVDWKRDLIGG